MAVVFESVYVLLEPYCEISAGLSHIYLLAFRACEFVYARSGILVCCLGIACQCVADGVYSAKCDF